MRYGENPMSVIERVERKVEELENGLPAGVTIEPFYDDFRPGDIRHSLADTTRAREVLGYSPTHSVDAGLAQALDWYAEHLAPSA